MKTLLTAIALMFCLGCSWPGTYWVDIRQDVHSYGDLFGPWDVRTFVDVRDWIGMCQDCIMARSVFVYRCDEIQREKDRQMEEALTVKENTERRLKTWQKCKY